MADTTHKETYIETVGRRKTAAARVRISKAAKTDVVVNEKPYTEYFPTSELQKIITDAFTLAGDDASFVVTAKVKGGGIHAQAEAVRHGIARGLVEYNAELRKELKRAGYIKRDPRMKERKKFGLRKARRAPQWSKR